MTTLTDIPTDSVLQRHAMTELNRILGLPPSDSVLRRHYEQLRAAQTMGGSEASPSSSSASAPMQAPAANRAAEPSPARGGLMGWLRRLLGG